MSISFLNHSTDFKLHKKSKVRKWLNDIIANYQFKTGSISFIFTSNFEIRKINNLYLKHDYFTDVITFNYSENNKILSGDIFISIETVESNSSLYQNTFNNELYRVMVHGILHLIGFNDETTHQKAAMTAEEDKCLSMLKI